MFDDDSVDAYSVVTRGWWKIPKTGYYQIYATGDDKFYVASSGETCPIQGDAWSRDSSIFYKSSHSSGPNTLHADATGPTTFYEADEMVYLRASATENSSDDWLEIGALYLGESLDADGNLVIPEGLIDSDEHFNREIQRFEIHQTQLKDRTLITPCTVLNFFFKKR